MLNQQFHEPFLAVVIDPTRTVSTGKVEIGAFRTYLEGYKPLDETVSEYQTILLNKIEDFGVHCKQYYSLDITYFKSSLDSLLLDLLWNKFWVNTLSSSPLLRNMDYIAGQLYDLAEKLEQAENQLAHTRMGSFLVPSQRKKEDESQLAKIIMYARCGSFSRAEQVFSEMEDKDLILWDSLISGYALHGYGKEAVSLFKHMKINGIYPDEVTFVGVLSACNLAGMVEDGLNLFDSMNIDYSVFPIAEYYACVVDLFGRVGRLEQGYILVKGMPNEPNAGIWGALLGACRIYLNPDVANLTAEKLFEFEPHMTSNYVGLSNIHAEACYRYALELHLCKSLWHFIFDPGGGRHMVAYLKMFLDGSLGVEECRHIDLEDKVKLRGKD